LVKNNNTRLIETQNKNSRISGWHGGRERGRGVTGGA